MTNEFPDEKRWNRADHDVTILASVDCHKAVRSRSSSGSSSAARASQELSIQTRIFKIIVIGDSNVGKTCLTFRFTGGTFPDKTEATIGVDFREKAVEIEGETIKVKLKKRKKEPRSQPHSSPFAHARAHTFLFLYLCEDFHRQCITPYPKPLTSTLLTHLFTV